MASQAEIEATYDYMDDLWRLSLGEGASTDITAALFDGDFSKSLDQAQRDKHAYILDQVGLRPGQRLLDVGCGWGGLLETVRGVGASGVGLTLSPRQAQCCRTRGLDTRLRDWKTIDPAMIGAFDTIVSVGAFEHFCSEQEYIAGEQDAIYTRFFEQCRRLVPRDARIFVQTMIWGPQVPDPAQISLAAPRGSDGYILGVVRRFYPGSWLPASLDQIVDLAAPGFELQAVKNGRLDYIETMNRWGRRLARPGLRKAATVLRLLPTLISDPDMRYRAEMVFRSYNTRCFERLLMDHVRVTLRAI